MGSVLVKDALEQVGMLLLDASPAFKRWKQPELIRYCNEGQIILAKFLPPSFARQDSVHLRPGTRQPLAFAKNDVIRGDGRQQLSDAVGIQLFEVTRSMGPDGTAPGLPMRVVSGRDLDMADPGWQSSRGATPFEYVYDPKSPRQFWVNPGVPDAPRQVWVEISWTPLPDALAASVDYMTGPGAKVILDVPDEHVPDLINYMVARANMKEASYADAGKSATFTGLFTNSLNMKVETLTGTNPNLKRLPLDTAIGGTK